MHREEGVLAAATRNFLANSDATRATFPVTRDVRIVDVEVEVGIVTTGSLVYLFSAFRKVRASLFDIFGCKSTLPVLFILCGFY